MVQPATLGLCISLLAEVFPVGAGSRVDLAAGARAEVNAGRIPLNSRDVSEPGTEETLVVRSGIRWISPTSQLSLKYTPQYYLRLPTIPGIERPLLLHDASLAWIARLNRRLTLNWNLRSSAGELSNSGLLTVFDPGTGRVESSIVPLVRINTTVGMRALTGKRHTTNATLTASHNDSLGTSTAIQRSDNIALTLSHAIGLSRRTSTGISAQGGYVAQLGQSESATVGGQLFVNQQLKPSASLRLAAGASQGWALGGDLTWPLPAVELAYQSTVAAPGQSWALSFTGGTRAFFDATSGYYRPQVYLAASASGRLGRAWTVGSSLRFSADVSGSSLTVAGRPTQINFDVPLSYRLTRSLALAFGLRLAVSAPPLSTWDTGPIQDQISAYVSLDWRTGSESTLGSWL